MPDPLDFTGQVVLVTGGAKGVGLGISEVFTRAGATVVACGRESPGAGPYAAFLTSDVRDPESVDAMVAALVAEHGRLDVAVNCAGGAPPSDAASVSPRFSESIIKLNLLGAIHVSQAANRVMHAQESGGSIVNITSVSAMRASPNTAVYGAAKAGLISLTASLAVEWAPKVRVNAVALGLMLTERSGLFYGDHDGVARVAATVPLGRLGDPADAGNACLFLASPLASYVSGSTLVVHGGGETPAYIDAAKPPE